MKKDTFEAQKPFAGEKKPSMNRRCVGHDYQERQMYMITMVTEGRQKYFGEVVGRCDATVGKEEAPHIELSPLGRAVKDCWFSIPHHYPAVKLIALQMMPDHLHGILYVSKHMDCTLGNVLHGFKTGCNKCFRQLMPVEYNAAMRQQTERNTKASGQRDREHGLLFAPNYNDKLLLREGQLNNWLHYLDDNPRRLAIKRLHPDYFTTMHYRDIAEWHCQLVGNSFLLDIPDMVAVIVHSAYTDEEYAEYKRQWLACGERGGILVSAAIATREKEVMREAMNRGYRIILVRENGFPPLYKPAGESFDACSGGRLLQVSPWEYHMQRRTISREQCLMLNRLVETITQLHKTI